MRNILKTISALAAAGALTLTGTVCNLPVGTNTTAVTAVAADDNNDDWIHAEGSKLYCKRYGKAHTVCADCSAL